MTGDESTNDTEQREYYGDVEIEVVYRVLKQAEGVLQEQSRMIGRALGYEVDCCDETDTDRDDGGDQ